MQLFYCRKPIKESKAASASKPELPKGFQRNVLKTEGRGRGVGGGGPWGRVCKTWIEMKQDPMALCPVSSTSVLFVEKKKFVMYKFNQRNEKMEKQRQSCQTGQNNK